MRLRRIPAAFLTLVLTANFSFAFGGKEKGKGKARPEGAATFLIFDIGTLVAGDSASQGFGVSPGGVGVGRSVRTGAAQAFSWTYSGGIVPMTNLSGRSFCVSNGANDAGSVVGTCANTLFGTARLPVIWQSGAPTQLNMPSGETLGDANDINASNVAVGSANSGSLQRAVIYSNGTGTFITQTTTGGSFMTTAFRINDSGQVVGQGIDPNNAARNVGILYSITGNTAIDIGALPAANGALAFDVSNAGHVVGSSMMNQGSGMPFIWTQGGGMTAIPLPSGTSQGSARGVNSSGWAVGTASSAFAIPFLYDGTDTYRLQDLIPDGTGWDLSTNTSSSALGISESHTIIGTGVLNGQVRAYAMLRIPAFGLAIGGRVLNAGGQPIKNARVTISGGNIGQPRTVYTGGLGIYHFPLLGGGQTYTVTVSAGKTTFAQPSQSVLLMSNVSNMDFTAAP